MVRSIRTTRTLGARYLQLTAVVRTEKRKPPWAKADPDYRYAIVRQPLGFN